MKASTLVRATAAAATAATLVLGAAGAATASEGHGSMRGERTSQTDLRGAGMTHRVDTAAKRAVGVKKVFGKSLVVNARKTRGAAGVKSVVNDSTVNSLRMRAPIKKGGKTVAHVLYNNKTGKGHFPIHRGDGRGKFIVGATHITGTRNDGTSFDYKDKTTGAFKVRSAIRGGLKMVRRGSHKTAKAHLGVYGAHGWTGYNGKAALQYKRSGHWNTLKVLRVRNGRDVYKFTTSAYRTYRLKIHKTPKHAGGTTNGVSI